MRENMMTGIADQQDDWTSPSFKTNLSSNPEQIMNVRKPSGPFFVQFLQFRKQMQNFLHHPGTDKEMVGLAFAK